MNQYLKTKDIPILKEKLLKKQNYICLICQRDLRKLEPRDRCLDHNHTTGFVRGVLCRGCNSMEGKVYKAFVRVGLRNQGVQYNSFLLGLEKYINIKETKYIYPKKAKGDRRGKKGKKAKSVLK